MRRSWTFPPSIGGRSSIPRPFGPRCGTSAAWCARNEQARRRGMRSRSGSTAWGRPIRSPGAAMVPGVAAQLRGEPAPIRRRPSGTGLLERARAAARAHLRRAGGRGPRDGGRAAGARHRPGRPGGGISAELAGSGHRHARHREPRRDLVVLLSRFRRQRGGRPVRPDPTPRSLLRRRLPVRRQADRLAGAGARGVPADPGHRAGGGGAVLERAAGAGWGARRGAVEGVGGRRTGRSAGVPAVRPSAVFRSTIRSTSCIPPAPLVSRSAWSTERAGRCFSTSRS